MNRNRQPEGIPSGGQWATESKTEVSLDLPDHVDSMTEEAGVPSLGPFLRKVDDKYAPAVEQMDPEWAEDIFNQSFYDAPAQVAAQLAQREGTRPMTQEQANARIESLRESYPLASELVQVALDREDLPLDHVHLFNESSADHIERTTAADVLVDIEDAISDGLCSRCGKVNRDGEGTYSTCSDCA